MTDLMNSLMGGSWSVASLLVMVSKGNGGHGLVFDPAQTIGRLEIHLDSE